MSPCRVNFRNFIPIWIENVFPIKTDVKNSTVFLDISARVQSGGEMGLLGLAFHPDYKNNGYFYVNYTKENPLETVISRFKVSSSAPDIADPNSEVVLLRYAQPYTNHNGGKLAFGNDGYLYIAVGDGGSGGDPQNNGQNKKVLLGKILRIDVDHTSGAQNYSIPADNPLKGNSSGYPAKKSMPMECVIPGGLISTARQVPYGPVTWVRTKLKK